MPERKVADDETLASDDIANNAVDLNVSTRDNAGSGSAVSIGEGILLTAAHNFTLNGESARRVRATLREGHDTEGDTKTARASDIHNIGDWSVAGATEPTDFAVVVTDIGNAPTASMIIFENPNNATGMTRSAGYPGQSPFNGEDMYRVDGNLSENSLRSPRAGDYLRLDKDSTPGADDGVGAVRGQSGSGVQLDYSLQSNDARLGSLDLNDKLAGTMTYGSINAAGDVSHDAERLGAGFTPITQRLYGRIGDIADPVARANSDAERLAAQRDEVRAEGGRWNRAARLEAEAEIANTPISDRELANRFAENVMVSNQSVTNEDAAQAIKDGKPQTSEFNGAMFNEINYANQNVSMNLNMGGGYDTADYFVIEAGRGLDVTVGREAITVQKSFTTVEQVQRDVVVDGVTQQEMVRERKVHSATDRWENTEALIGSGSSDRFVIDDLSGVEKLDGRDLPLKADGTAYAENDTLSLADSVGPVSWEFDRREDGSIDRENGWVSDGTHRIRFENMETVNTRDGDTVDGVIQGAAPATEAEVKSAPIGHSSLHDTVAFMNDNMDVMMANLETKAARGEITPEEAVLADILNTQQAGYVFGSLHDHGFTTLPVDIDPNLPPETNGINIYSAVATTMAARGLAEPDTHEDREADQDHKLETRLATQDDTYDAAYT